MLCILYIRLRIPLLHFGRGELVLDPSMLARTLNYSWVTALQQTCIYIGKLAVQGAVNPLGVDSIAAFNAVARVDDFAITPMQSIGSALTTFVAQNHGAHNEGRIHKGLATGAAIGTAYWASSARPSILGRALSCISSCPPAAKPCWPWGPSICTAWRFFISSPPGPIRCRAISAAAALLTATLVSSLLQIVIRVICSYWLAPATGIGGIALACGIGWTAMMLYELPLYLRDRGKRKLAA